MRLWTLTLLLGGVLLSSLLPPSGGVWAADGDACSTDNFTLLPRGVWKPVWCIVLCDDDTAAAGSCSDYNFATAGTPAGNTGGTDFVSFEVGSDNDCGAGTVTLATTWISGGQSHDLGATTTLDLSGVGTTRIIQAVNQGAPLAAIVETDFAGVGGCTGGFDIIMIGYEELRQ